MCFNPIAVRVSINNYGTHMKSFLNKRFVPEHYDLAEPFKIDIHNNYKTIYVSCGKCYQCRMTRVNTWILRATHELFNYRHNAVMVTLTYNNDNNLDKSLDYTHFQKFLKLLRFHLKGRKISYLAVGEYGYKSDRKHFHAFILGLTDKDKHLIAKCWPYGFTYTKQADVNALRYILKYSFKQQFKSKNYYVEKGLLPPMFHCSKGFGKNVALNKYQDFLSRGYFAINQFKYPIPRYYYKLLVSRGIIHNTYKNDNLDWNKLLYLHLLAAMPKERAEELSSLLDVDNSSLTMLNNILSLSYSYYSDKNKRKYNNFIDRLKEAV